MLRRARLVGFLWRWHRRAGLLAALFLLLMSLSGIVLNHGDDLALEQRFVAGSRLRALYGDAAASWSAFRAGTRWVSGNESGRIFLDTRELPRCEGGLRGVVETQGMLLLACEWQLLLLSVEGELVDTLAAASGLSLPVSGLGLAGHVAVVRIAGQWRSFDPETMSIGDALAGRHGVVESKPGDMPPQLREQLDQRSAWLSWERVLIDFHSGRLFGRPGVWVVDLAGVLLCILALSGVTMWWLHRRRGE